MIGNNFLHISQSQSKPLHIVQITRMHTIELFKYLFQVFLLDTNTVILYRNHQFTRFIPRFHLQFQILFRFFIFYRVIHQIEDHIGKMHFICKYNRIGSLKVRCYLTIISFHFQCKGIDHSRYQFVRIDFLHLQRCLLPVKH